MILRHTSLYLDLLNTHLKSEKFLSNIERDIHVQKVSMKNQKNFQYFYIFFISQDSPHINVCLSHLIHI